MRTPHGKTLRLAAATMAMALAANAVPALHAGEDNPFPYKPSAALPSTDDLVIFDEPADAAAATIDVQGANQSAFPVYYGTTPPESPAPAQTAGAPEPDGPDLAAATGTTGALNLQPTPETSSLPGGTASPNTAALTPGMGIDATPLAPPPLPELPATQPEIAQPRPDVNQVRADFNQIKAFCEADSLGSAAEIYARMPGFGDDEEVNRLRADAANLLILGLSRTDNLSAARRIYDSVPTDMPGYDATLAKARGVINLATYYVRAERYNDAYDVLMDIGDIRNRSALNNELFRLMARMIPYLDNAEETEKATAVYDLLLNEVASPGGAALFAENVQGVIKYYLHYVDKTESPIRRRKRLDFLEHAFASMERLSANPDIRLARKNLGAALAERYAGNPERAAKFYVED